MPNDVTIGNNLTVTGTLTVNGTTTTINSTQLDVDDLNITIASGAGNAAAANGAGITVDGASATLTYTSSNDRWNFNKELVVARVHGNVTGNVTGTTSDISNHAVGALSDVYTTGITNGQALIWNNSNSRFEPGASFSQSDFNTAFAAKNVGGLNDVDTTGVTNGQVLAYSSGNSRFEPTTISGYATSNFNTDFASKDTDDLSEGTTNLYYTNTRVNSFLTGGTVSQIRTSDLDIKNTAGTESIASFAQNGSVALYYDNSNKFATTTNGVRVTGNIVISSNTSQYFDEDYVVDNYSDTHEVTFTANNITADRTISFPDASGTILLTSNSIGTLSDVDITTSAPTNGQALIWNASNSEFEPGTVGGQITVQDEGSALSTTATTLNFVGANITATGGGAEKTITVIAGAGGTFAANAVGVHTTKLVGVNTTTIAGTATSEGAVQVRGNIAITEGLLTLDSNLHTSVSVPTGKNAMLIGPTTVAVGATIDVAQGSTLVVV